MATKIFINLPVVDLPRSIRFYEALGARNDPRFTDETAAGMAFSDTIHVMLLTHEKWCQFTSKPIVDARAMSEAAFALACDSREQVNQLMEAAAAQGGRKDVNPQQDHGFMFSRSLEDPDGHVWEPMWFDRDAFEALQAEQPAT